MDAKKDHSSKFTVRCANALDSRTELWKLAQINKDDIQGLGDLAYLINNSQSRNYLFAILFLIVLFVFFVGMFCRAALNREYRFQKLK